VQFAALEKILKKHEKHTGCTTKTTTSMAPTSAVLYLPK